MSSANAIPVPMTSVVGLIVSPVRMTDASHSRALKTMRSCIALDGPRSILSTVELLGVVESTFDIDEE